MEKRKMEEKIEGTEQRKCGAHKEKIVWIKNYFCEYKL